MASTADDMEMGSVDGPSQSHAAINSSTLGAGVTYDATSRDSIKDHTPSAAVPVGPNVMEAHMEYMRTKYPDVYIRQPTEKSSYVYLSNNNAAGLFDEVKAYREENPDKNMNDAVHHFMPEPDLEREALDAIIKAVYRSRKADFVLKYDDKCKSLPIRAAWEHRVLRKDFVLVHETGLEVDEAFVLVFTPFAVLCDLAEDREINFGLKHDEPPVAAMTKWQKFRKFFELEDRVTPEPSANFQRGRLPQLRGSDSEHPVSGDDEYGDVVLKFFRPAHRNYLTHHLLTRVVLSIKEIKELNPPDFPTKKRASVFNLLSNRVYDNFFPRHDGSMKSHQPNPNARTKLKRHWSKSFFTRQPMDQIREYFGERIALYFAFLGFYTVWLIWAALFGLLVAIFGIINAVDGNFTLTATGSTRLFDNELTLPFAAFMSIWATMYLEFWKRKNAYLAWWWDVMDFEELETERPEWYGTEIRVSPVTNRRELHYPNRSKIAKMTVSFMCLAIAILIVLLSVTGAVVYRVWVRNRVGVCELSNGLMDVCTGVYNLTGVTGCNDVCWSQNITTCANATADIWTPNDVPNLPLCEWDGTYCIPACTSYTTEIPCSLARYNSSDGTLRSTCSFVDRYYISTITAAIVNLVAIVVLNGVFTQVARMLNDWENHRTQTEWEDALIIKAFFFQFLNSYTSLFYIGFFKQATATNMFGNRNLIDTCSYSSCFTELMIQLAIVFVGKQFINQIQEILVPWIKNTIRRKKDAEHKAHMEKRFQEDRANNVLIKQYAAAVDPASDMDKPPQWFKDSELEKFGNTLFDEYNEMALQFGFITLFVVAFPLGPFFALINNAIEIRTDSYKLITKLQRPTAKPAEDIGSWYTVLNSLSILAVITNSFLVAFSSAWLKDVIINGITYYQITSLADLKLMIVAFQLVVILVFEHVVFGLKILVAFLIPDIPGPVKMAIEREQYLQKIAFEGEEEGQIMSDTDLDEALDDMTKGKGKKRA